MCKHHGVCKNFIRDPDKPLPTDCINYEECRVERGYYLYKEEA